MSKPHRPRALLVMSGGMNGYSFHMGVMDALRSTGSEIVGLVGASAGALASALYASGVEARRGAIDPPYAISYLARFLGRKFLRVLRGDPMAKTGLLDGELIAGWLLKVGVPGTFGDLKIPIAVAVVDAVTLDIRLIHGKRTRLRESVAASCAVPSLFEQQADLDLAGVFVDGAVLSRLPLAIGVEWARRVRIEFDIVVASCIAKSSGVRGMELRSRYHKMQDVESRLQIENARRASTRVEVIQHPPSRSRLWLAQRDAIAQYHDANRRALEILARM